MSEDRFSTFQCNDCGGRFKVELVESEDDVVCPVCTVPRVYGEGTNITKID